MRRLVRVVAALAALALSALVLPAPASAAEVNPVRYCQSVYQPLTNPVTGDTYPQYVVPVQYGFGEDTVVELGLPSFRACVSTVAQGMEDGVVPAAAISKLAYLGQCDLLETAGVVSYPYEFYGTYPAENRADCARILQGVHSGTLPLPGPPPAA